MKYLRRLFIISSFLLLISVDLTAQIDDICNEFGFIPTLEAPRLTAPFVYGKITIKSNDPAAKFPKVSIVYLNRGQTPDRITISKSGNYCFKITGGSGGTLVVDIDGVEVARRAVSSFGTAQQREDFEVEAPMDPKQAAPGVVSSKYFHPRNEKALELFKNASEAEAAKNYDLALRHLRDVVAADPTDFVGWGLIARLELERNKLDDAESALRRSLELQAEYVPAWITAGRVRMEKKQYEAAIEVFKHVITLYPTSAPIYQLLGESYLRTKQGTLGVNALNKAIELDPVGMAECHLQLAHLYQLAKANQMAAEEYKKFLEKVPDHPDKLKFEKFINENQ